MSGVIDVSLLPAPEAIRPLSYDRIKAERLVELQRRMRQAGIDYDVSSLETDPGVILQEVDAYRELLDKASINDSVRAVLPAFSKGANLDHIVARANVVRQVVTPADPSRNVAEVLESDSQLLDRYLLSFEAPAAGSDGGYIYRAASAWPGRHDIAAVHGGPGKVLIYLLGPNGARAPLDVVLRVALVLQGKGAKGLTDDVTVMAAEVDSYSVALRLQVPRGPDVSLIQAQAERAVRAVGAERYRIGAEVPANALTGAAYVPNVSRVIAAAGLVDRPARRGVAPWLARLTITTEVVG